MGIEIGPFLSQQFNSKGLNLKEYSQQDKFNFIFQALEFEIGFIPLVELVDLLAQLLSLNPNICKIKEDIWGVNLIGVIWFSRKDLIDVYDPNRLSSKALILEWWVENGQKEYSNLINKINSMLEYQFLFNSESIFSKLNITVGTLVVLRLAFNRNINPTGEANFEFAQQILSLISSETHYWDVFYSIHDLTRKCKDSKEIETILRELVFFARLDVRTAYKNIHSNDYLIWWDEYGKREYQAILEKLLINFKNPPKKGVSLILFDAVETNLKFGTADYPLNHNFFNKVVNVVGIPGESKGVSEDFRCVTNALNHVGFDVNALIYPEAFNKGNFKKTFNLFDFRGKTNIFVQSPFLTIELYLKFGKNIFLNHKNYVFWQWEFESISKKLTYLPPVIDEIWTISSFTAKAFKNNLNVPVVVVPQVVSLSTKVIPNRSEYLLNENCFYYMFAFDGQSGFERKNPLAVVEAFKKGFSINNSLNVGLVIKAHNLNHRDLLSLKESIIGDSRIVLINEDFSRQAFIGLMCVIDCFISLHRSEGFGRLLAEAMLMKKAVIASNYSGNLDFMNEENSYLVKGKLIKVSEEDYQAIDNSSPLVWYEPDINDAIFKMNEVLTRVTERNEKIVKAHQKIINSYSWSNFEEFLKLKLQN